MQIQRTRNTKILATLGPASSDEAVLRKLFEAGVDLFRLNFSHGSAADHKARMDIIRKLEAEYDRPIGVVADLQGPKLRVGKFAEGSIELEEGMVIRFDLDPTPGDTKRVQLPHPEVIKALTAGEQILMDDGKVRIEIVEQGKDYLMGKVIAGRKLSNNKGFNVPGVVLPISALTDKDRKDLVTALDIGADWIAQSFVQRPEDVAEAKKLIGGRAALMIKVEKPSALTCLDEMLDICDGVMLARGDLGVEIPPEDVPSVQKEVVRKVRAAGKPIVVATQMLESMIESPAPTRAEASDVANAVYDGTDAVMLSAETAAGAYPIESVTIMSRILEKVEKDPHYRRLMESSHLGADEDPSDAITVAADQVARDIRAACIVNYTTSGSTVLRTARQRPAIPILCLTQNLGVARRLSVSYGVRGVHVTDVNSFAETVERATELAKEKGLAKTGQSLVLTAGVPFGTPGSTNVLRVAWVK
ncbi:MAG: pyruvate kinase [Pseudobdellovibrionaceae bacterium]